MSRVLNISSTSLEKEKRHTGSPQSCSICFASPWPLLSGAPSVPPPGRGALPSQRAVASLAATKWATLCYSLGWAALGPPPALSSSSRACSMSRGSSLLHPASVPGRNVCVPGSQRWSCSTRSSSQLLKLCVPNSAPGAGQTRRTQVGQLRRPAPLAPQTQCSASPSGVKRPGRRCGERSPAC